MKNNFGKVANIIVSLMNDNVRPGLIVNLDGTIDKENDSFRACFLSDSIHTMKDLIDWHSFHLWDQFVHRVQTTNQFIMEKFPLNLKVEGRTKVQTTFIYVPDFQSVVALFEIPLPSTRIPYNTYENTFRSAYYCMLIVDEDGMICDANERVEEYFGIHRNKIIGTYLKEHKFNCSHSFQDVLKEQMIKAKTRGVVETTKSFEQSSPNTKHYHITTFYEKDTNLFTFHLDDYSEKENLEERLAHSGTLSAVGQIAASIAHEIRNPMTTLKGFTQLLKVSTNEDSLRYISVIEDELNRMESILNEMLILSKPVLHKKTTFSLKTLVEDMIGILYPKALMEEIEIIHNYDLYRLPFIYGDLDKMKQVLLNVFKNALESMQPGGKLTVLLKETENHLVLAIQDTGKGMTMQQINQIFLPFVSSKESGTGLGLPFVLKTMEEHSGSVTVESELNVGTTFYLKFPLVSEGQIDSATKEKVPS